VAEIGTQELETHLDGVGLEMEVGAYFEMFTAAIAKDMAVSTPNTASRASLSLDLTYRLGEGHSDLGCFLLECKMPHVPMSMMHMIFELPVNFTKKWRANGFSSFSASSAVHSTSSTQNSVSSEQSSSQSQSASPQKRKGPMSLGNPNRRQQKKKRGGGAVLAKKAIS
jgi:hypothetical protein